MRFYLKEEYVLKQVYWRLSLMSTNIKLSTRGAKPFYNSKEKLTTGWETKLLGCHLTKQCLFCPCCWSVYILDS